MKQNDRDIKLIKLITGEEIVAEITESVKTGILLKYPLLLTYSSTDEDINSQTIYVFSAWVPLDEGNPIFIKSDHILFEYNINDFFVRMYSEVLITTIEETKKVKNNIDEYLNKEKKNKNLH